MKFRKKPVVIEAVQWFKDNDHPAVIHSSAMHAKPISPGILYPSNKRYIRTLEGNMEVTPGDWIITGVKGEHYPCKPDIFEATYEAVKFYGDLPEPEQDDEPVAWISHNGFRFNADIEPIEHGIEVPLYLHPAPRPEFVKLSEEEVIGIVRADPDFDEMMWDCTSIRFARAIEDALEEKNTINRSDPDSVDLQSRCRGDKP